MPRKIEPDHGQAFVLRKREEKKHARVPPALLSRAGPVRSAVLACAATRRARPGTLMRSIYTSTYVRTKGTCARAYMTPTYYGACTSPHLTSCARPESSREGRPRASIVAQVGGPDDPHHSSRFSSRQQSRDADRRCRQARGRGGGGSVLPALPPSHVPTAPRSLSLCPGAIYPPRCPRSTHPMPCLLLLPACLPFPRRSRQDPHAVVGVGAASNKGGRERGLGLSLSC